MGMQFHIVGRLSDSRIPTNQALMDPPTHVDVETKLRMSTPDEAHAEGARPSVATPHVSYSIVVEDATTCGSPTSEGDGETLEFTCGMSGVEVQPQTVTCAHL